VKIIGITGTFGSGKSSAAKMFAALGAYLVDHDAINHEIMKKGGTAYNALLNEYGPVILGDDDEIVRAKVAEVAFSSLDEVRKIEKTLHPLIINAEEELVDKYKDEQEYGFIVFDTPLLFESKRNEVCDYTVVIASTEDKLIERIKKTFGLGIDDIRKRIALQMSLNDKAKLADFVIENNGTLDELNEKVSDLFNKIKGGQV
jgi:dephospho-CoA kinase